MNICIDIDGVLTNETKGFDFENRTPNIENINILNQLYSKHNIVLFTARDIMDKTKTITWLKQNDVLYHDIIFNKPKYDIFIDDLAHSDIKKIKDI